MMNSLIKDYSEKRDFIRMQVNAEITLIVQKTNQTIKAICKDLSGTGMQIETEEAIDAGTEMHTMLPSNNESFPPFETQVVVRRCEETAEGKYLLGTEILTVKGQ